MVRSPGCCLCSGTNKKDCQGESKEWRWEVAGECMRAVSGERRKGVSARPRTTSDRSGVGAEGEQAPVS